MKLPAFVVPGSKMSSAWTGPRKPFERLSAGRFGVALVDNDVVMYLLCFKEKV